MNNSPSWLAFVLAFTVLQLSGCKSQEDLANEKTAEANEFLKKMSDEARAYYDSPRFQDDAAPVTVSASDADDAKLDSLLAAVCDCKDLACAKLAQKKLSKATPPVISPDDDTPYLLSFSKAQRCVAALKSKAATQ